MLLLYKAMQVTLCEKIHSAAPRLVSSSKVHKERTRSSSDLLSKHIVENKMKKKVLNELSTLVVVDIHRFAIELCSKIFLMILSEFTLKIKILDNDLFLTNYLLILN